MGGCQELTAAQTRWLRVARQAALAGGKPEAVFAMARAVVCGWWQKEAFWQRERAWGRRLERVALETSCRDGPASGWPEAWWRLVARDAVVFPEVVTVAAALVDPVLQSLVPFGRSLVRRAGDDGRFVAALANRLGRSWLAEVERPDEPGALQAWMNGLARKRRSPSSSGSVHRSLWFVQMAHRPVEVGAGLRLLATAAPNAEEEQREPAGWRPESWVPRRTGHGADLTAVAQRRFLEGLDHARAYAVRYGHLAVSHASAPQDGFDLGRWLANLRAASADLPSEQVRLLAELDVLESPLADKLAARLA